MAPLPPSTTPRVQVTYTSGGRPHTAEVRMAIGSIKADGELRAQALADVMATCMASGDGTVGAFWIPAGTNIRQTLPLTPATGGGSAGTITPESQACFLSFTGRSDDGRDVKFSLFTILFDGQTTYRIPLGSASSVVQDLWAEVVNAADPSVTISGEVALWNAYVNIGQNAYYQRKSR